MPPPRTTKTPTLDPDVGGVYTAEDRLARWLDLGTVTVFGSRWALEPEVVFARVDDAQRYVDRVLTHLAAHGWRTHGAGGCPLAPVAVRPRRGALKAHYEQHKHTIAIPPAERGGGWALRESVVLHELAHHLVAIGADPPGAHVEPPASPHDPPASPHGPPAPHGPRFRRTLLAVFVEAGHPTAAALLGIAFADEGLAT